MVWSPEWPSSAVLCWNFYQVCHLNASECITFTINRHCTSVNLCTFYTILETLRAKWYLQDILTKQTVSIVYKRFENVGKVTCKKHTFVPLLFDVLG
jgi:hypothetical protein